MSIRRSLLIALILVVSFSAYFITLAEPVRAASTTIPCEGPSTSLNLAILNANTNPGPDTLELDGACHYYWGTALVVTSQITINGHGASIAHYMDYKPQDHVMVVQAGGNLTLNQVTITRGSVGDAEVMPGVVDPRNIGGGILNYGILTVNDATFSENTAWVWNVDRGAGGAIFNYGTLNVHHSTFSNNGAHDYGDAIANAGGTVTITDSTFEDNYNTHGSVIYIIGYGGAIYSDGGTVSVDGSTFESNHTSQGGAVTNWSGTVNVTKRLFKNNIAGHTADCCGGGAILNRDQMTVSTSTFGGNHSEFEAGAIFNQGVLSVSRSTFANNSSSNSGGGIYAWGEVTLGNDTFTSNSGISGSAVVMAGNGHLMMVNNTIAGNTTPGGSGGAIHLGQGQITLKNTIIANNTPDNCAGYALTDGGGNLTWPAEGNDCIYSGFQVGDSWLAALADNGGPNQTLWPQIGSAAVNHGDDAVCAAVPVGSMDQRGVSRPAGAHCDIGAVEVDKYKLFISFIRR